MPRAFEPLPPDDPIFTRGVSFVFRHELPSSTDASSRGFRAWLAEPNERLVVCDCGWAPELGEHYRNKGGTTVIEHYVPSDQGWGIVVGRLREPPAEKPAQSEEQPPEEQDA